jgi:hypothetical protein
MRHPALAAWPELSFKILAPGLWQNAPQSAKIGQIYGFAAG